MSFEFPKLPPLRIGTFIGILHLFVGLLGAGILTVFSLYFIYKGSEQVNLREIKDLAFVIGNGLEHPLMDLQSGVVNTSQIDDAMTTYLRTRPEIGYSILTPSGTVILTSHPPRTAIAIDARAPEIVAASRSLIGQSIRPGSVERRVVYVASPIEHDNLLSGILVLAVPLDTMMASTYRTMLLMSIIALLIVAFTVFEGWLGSIYISKPLASLSKVAALLSQGDMTARADLGGPVEVKNLAQTLNEMADRVQRSLESMRAFVANASHELRTPLTTIKLQVGALSDGACQDREVAGHFLAQIEGEIDRLNDMVNDMLDLSQIEAGVELVDRQPVNISELAEEVTAFWQARSLQAGLTLTLTEDSTPAMVSGDPQRFRQLFDNLLDNAVKNTNPGGKIEIAIQCCDPGDRNRLCQTVRIEVRDTGIGIAPEHLPNIFDRFYRIEMRRRAKKSVSENTAAKSVGSGLGLAIAHSIVLAHGGEIGVTSQPGIGTTFWVEFPAI